MKFGICHNLEAAPDARPITEAGETFEVDMDRTPLGDIPGMTKYKVQATVTRYLLDKMRATTDRRAAERSQALP